MIQAPAARLVLAGLFALALASCAAVPSTEEGPPLAVRTELYESRHAALTAFDRWSMDGRLAVSDSEDGGSGKLEWRKQPDLSELDFRGALGRGAWQLDIRPGHAVLSLGTGETFEAPEVSELVQNHVGWHIPVGALEWWIRGLAEPQGKAEHSLDEAGRITQLSQYGWTVEYDRYKEFSGIQLPTKIEARKGARLVKLIMREWSFSSTPEHDS
ncbi:MAG: lipoprotein insertase outer membrane protein LolB [Xanthomonadales bacterium]|nr:lipoprotein insertase outer membrane protein LolB [Xanthomonadales bacterium]